MHSLALPLDNWTPPSGLGLEGRKQERAECCSSAHLARLVEAVRAPEHGQDERLLSLSFWEGVRLEVKCEVWWWEEAKERWTGRG